MASDSCVSGGIIMGLHCGHYSRDAPHLDRLLREIVSSEHLAAACEHCPAEAKAKAGTSDVWVCLDCGRRFCGGLVCDTVPYGHARLHARKHRHSWLARCDKPTIVYCVVCKNEVPIEMPAAETSAAAAAGPDEVIGAVDNNALALANSS